MKMNRLLLLLLLIDRLIDWWLGRFGCCYVTVMTIREEEEWQAGKEDDPKSNDYSQFVGGEITRGNEHTKERGIKCIKKRNKFRIDVAAVVVCGVDGAQTQSGISRNSVPSWLPKKEMPAHSKCSLIQLFIQSPSPPSPTNKIVKLFINYPLRLWVKCHLLETCFTEILRFKFHLKILEVMFLLLIG